MDNEERNRWRKQVRAASLGWRAQSELAAEPFRRDMLDDLRRATIGQNGRMEKLPPVGTRQHLCDWMNELAKNVGIAVRHVVDGDNILYQTLDAKGRVTSIETL